MKKLLGIVFFLLGAVCFSNDVAALGIVSLPGTKISDLLGSQVNLIQVYRITAEGSFRPIPFQIDEKEGTYAKTNTGNVRAWALDSSSGKKAANGILEEDEFLLWRLGDGGTKVYSPELLKDYEKVWEVSIQPDQGPYFYLVLQKGPIPKNNRKYLQYDKAQDRVKAPGYEIRFNRRYPLVQEVLKIANGSIPYDILDRFKARFFLDVKNFFDFKFDEQEVKAKVLGTKAGPIRVIRRVVASKSLGPIKLVPKSIVEFYFYPYWFQVPTKINNPVDGNKVLNPKTQGLSGFDFNNYILGSDLKTNLGGLSLRLDGKNSGGLEKISGENFRWWSLNGVSGSMVQSIKNDPQLRQLGIYPYLILINDSSRKNPPESEAGEVFIGFDLPYHKIPKGRYQVEVKQVFPQEFISGKEEDYLRRSNLIQPQLIKLIK